MFRYNILKLQEIPRKTSFNIDRTMGQTLSEPVTAKETSCCENALYKVGSSCMQGWRINMEDAHTHILSLPDDPTTPFFGVYDGHGGAKIAQYAGRHLHKYIIKRPEYQEENSIVDALQQGFLALDAAMQEEETLKDELAGTTAISIIIKNEKLYCANVGDSRAIACIAGHVNPLSFDHKPSNEDEAKRINAAGGWVELNRVNGNLALSRALGDFVFKKNEKKRPEEQIVSAFPDVTVKDITPDWEFVVMACDGIWDVMTNEEVSDFVRLRVGTGMEPESICEDLMTRCLAPDCQMGGLGCDNMTVVIICFLNNKPYSDLVARCAEPARPT
ncbi:probable protein phosphatase 2C T23F11.1 isoform X1 [Homalodisca vitripennis]|uniref:protein-serine/threonine phosphatase n=2 Tax=Homalodisca liturata TaxID=320908 RepID=A0A1B6I6F6_9HEMI|nr:probable protein phosphatase 2C T23F11.1 isoform X1 [Homalodisca vitripennis]